MSMTVKYSDNIKAVNARMKRLPEYYVAMVKAIVKKDAVDTITAFHDGIKNKTLGLEKLAESTIKRKRRLGLERPSTPLYGMGDTKGMKAYANILRIREIKTGYRVGPARKGAMHHSQKIELQYLFYIHEYGCVLKNGGRIPPRPALYYAYTRTMKARGKKENGRKMKKAIAEYISNGKARLLDQIAAQNAGDKYDDKV